jgi:MoaA/NifB/PqqE/SkfB family radical SAM enzyme
MRAGKQPIPLQVQLIISDLCNHDCNFCAYRMSGYPSNQHFGVVDPETHLVNNNPNRMIPYEKCLEILDDCVAMGVPAVIITGGGEPTVHPKASEIFQAVVDRKLELALETNGTLIPEKMFAPLSRATWVRVSVDAGTSETYAILRKVAISTFDRMWLNVRRLCAEKDKGSVLGISFVVTRENYEELVTCAKLAKENGADNFRIGAAFTLDSRKYHEPHLERACALAARVAAEFASPSFTVINQFDTRVRDFKQLRPDYTPCPSMNLIAYIGGDQKLYRCCTVAYSDRGEFGSLIGKRFKDVWASPEKEADFAKFDARGCSRCTFNSKNRFMNYVTSPNPTHINFI